MVEKMETVRRRQTVYLKKHRRTGWVMPALTSACRPLSESPSALHEHREAER